MELIKELLLCRYSIEFLESELKSIKAEPVVDKKLLMKTARVLAQQKVRHDKLVARIKEVAQ